MSWPRWDIPFANQDVTPAEFVTALNEVTALPPGALRPPAVALNPPTPLLPKQLVVRGATAGFFKTYAVFADGVTDDSGTHTTAYADAKTNSGSLKLHVGVCALANGLVWNGQVSVYGEGLAHTQFLASAAIDMITLASGVIDCTLAGFTLNGGAVANRGFNVTGTGAIQQKMREVEVFNCLGTPGSGFESLGLNAAYSMTWWGVKLNSNKYGLRVTGSAGGSPNENSFFGCLIYYNSAGNVVLGDGVSVLGAWNFYGCDFEIQNGQGPIDNILLKGVQPCGFYGGFMEGGNNAGNTLMRLSSATPSVVTLSGIHTNTGGVAPVPFVIDAAATLSVLLIETLNEVQNVTTFVTDNSAASRVTITPSFKNGSPTNWQLIGSSGLIQALAGGFDFRSSAGGFSINYNNGNAADFQYYGGTANGQLRATSGGLVFAGGQIYPGLPTLGQQTNAGLLAGAGAPNNVNGNNGDIYFRSDGGAGTTIYQKRAGAWVATAA